MGDFWDSGRIDEIEGLVEDEVYDAVRRLLLDDDPYWLLWFFSVPAGEVEPCLRLFVDGRGRPDIDRRFKLSELVDDALEGHDSPDGSGINYLDSADRTALGLMRDALQRETDRISSFLAGALDDNASR